MKKIIKRAIQITILAAVLALFAWTLFFLYGKSKEKPIIYETASPVITDIVRKTVATGSVIPRKEVAIRPKVSGIIKEIYIEAGEIVKKDDNIARVQVVPDMVQLSSAESRVKMAEINFISAEKTFEKQRELYQKKLVAETDYIDKKASFDMISEELEAARDNLQLIRDGLTKRKGSVTNTVIKSTIDGMVLSVNVEEGSSVIESNTFNEGTNIAGIADMGEMIFKGQVDEAEVGNIKEGMELLLTIGALEDVQFRAVLEYISPKGVEEQGAIQFEIKAAVVLDEQYFIRAGYSATADIVLERRESVLAVSENLLQFDGDRTFVEIEKASQQFEKRYIETGLSDGMIIEAVSGLKETDKIKIPK